MGNLEQGYVKSCFKLASKSQQVGCSENLFGTEAQCLVPGMKHNYVTHRCR